ncbi:MAG: threonine/serine exporter family protein [Oscillospiraceae bacterium]|nr:threonine/serine exporter family protein [Oscillospiraceae bacterium]
MDYNILMDLVSELGYRLSMCGAETFRVEESINRILTVYGIQSEAYSIPNCLIVSIETPEGKPMTRMRRIGHHGNDLDGVEKYNSLSRRICEQAPEPKQAMQWLSQTDATMVTYSFPMILISSFLGAFGFSFLFGATLLDGLFAGLCGILIGCVNRVMNNLETNQFFRTIVASFLMATPPYILGALGLTDNADAVIIAAIMLLVPGLLFVNAMRDIIYGDTNSGINRIMQVLLIAAALCLGTGTAWTLVNTLIGVPLSPSPLAYNIPIQLVACFIGCFGFSMLFNIHGPGILLCMLGGILTWLAYLVLLELGCDEIMCYFLSTVVAAAYAEIMARVRKYPAISYLVVSIFPLIPGAGVYYTMNYAVRGDMASFAQQGTHTIAIAGVMAVGMLMVSTVVRLWSTWQRKQNKK